MEIYPFLCALIVCSIFKGAFTCQGRDVEDISRVLAYVPDLKGLANWLDIRSNDIETKCAQDLDPAACYRRELVRRYCDSQHSEDPHKVTEDIAQALEKMTHKLQAQQLRKKFNRGHGAMERERDKQAGGDETMTTQPPPQELADSRSIPHTQSASESGVIGVRATIKQLRHKFKKLEESTEMDLEKERVLIKKLIKVIFSLPTAKMELHREFLIKYAKELKSSDSINEVFLKLDTHKYWDYLNIDILEHIIIEFFLPSQMQLDTYRTQQQQFMEETTVDDFYEAEGDRRYIDPPPAFVELISQHKWEPPTYLKKVDEFRKKFAFKYDLRESAVLLVSMRGGSAVITMMIPESLVAMVKSTDIEFFKEHGIVHLLLNGTCVYKQTEDEVSPSAEHPSLEGQSQLFPGPAPSVSVAGTTGVNASLTSLTHPAGPSPPPELSSMRPHPLQPLETATSTAALLFMFGGSVTEAVLWFWWTLLDAYVRIWLGQDAAFFIVQCCLCAAVVLLYGVLLHPPERGGDEDYHLEDGLKPKLRLLCKHLPLFQQLVDIEKLLPVLYQYCVLEYNEVKSIQREESRNRRIMSLVDVIQRKGKTGVKMLIECIKKESDHLGHVELAEELKKIYVTSLEEEESRDGVGQTAELPSLRDLMTELYNTVPTKWEPIGLHLGLSASTLDSVAASNLGNPQKCLLETLKLWLKGLTPPPSWEAVIEAVEFVGEEQVASKLRRKYSSPPSQ